MKTVFINAKVITPELEIKGGVVVDNGKIERVFRNDEYEKGLTTIDCKGNYLTPGFVDTHIHQTKYGSFSNGNREELERSCKFMAEHGTTAVLPTCASNDMDKIYEAFDCIKATKGKNEGAKILGGHLEGVYMNPSFMGAQAPSCLHDPIESEYMKLLDTGILKRVSASPELNGALEMGRKLSREGVLMSIAHSAANYSQVLAAIDAGYSHATHIYNALSYLDNCYYYPQIGACEASLLHDEITVEAICDGRHLPPELLRLMHKIKGADRFHATTDACFSGAVNGETFDEGRCIVKDDVCVLTDKNVFAGSSATSDRMLKVIVGAGIPLVDAIKMLSLTPARTIGADSIGRISAGYDADINIVNSDLDVVYTMINGKEFRNVM